MDVGEAYNAFTSRLQALSEAQNLLVVGSWRSASLSAIIDAALSGCGGRDDRFRISGPEVKISAASAVSITLAVHELCTNASKYGALSVAGGSVEISWGLEALDSDNRYFFEWREAAALRFANPRTRGSEPA